MFKIYTRIAELEQRVTDLESAINKSKMQHEEIESLRKRCSIQQSIINKQNEQLKNSRHGKGHRSNEADA